MFKKFRQRLSQREEQYFKLAVWSAIITWIVSFIIISFVVAGALDYMAGILVDGLMGHVVGFLWATSYVMVVLLTIYKLVKWVNKKLRSNHVQ
jgi:hypothetical protein